MPSPSLAGSLSFYEDFPYAWWTGLSGPDAMADQGVELPAGLVHGGPLRGHQRPAGAQGWPGCGSMPARSQRLFDDEQGMLDAVTSYAARIADDGRVGSGAAERYWAVVRS